MAANTITPIPRLIAEYEQATAETDDKRSARIAFAIASRIGTEPGGTIEQAREWARTCLAIASRLPSATLDDVTSDEQYIGGVAIPDLFHDGVVRERLANLLTD
jgi:hypothetical protein